MNIQSRVLTILAATTFLGGAAHAANQVTGAPPTESAAQAIADRDVGKLSADGAAAFRDLHLARLAIFNANPTEAKALIAKAQTEIGKAKAADAIFTKAESDLKQPPVNGKAVANNATPGTPDAAKPIAWLPVDGQLALSDDFVATPQKAAAVTEANKSLSKGDRKGALEKLKLADVNVSFTMAVVPLDSTISDIDKAAALIGEGKYYEANGVLKLAEDGVRFDMIDMNALPKANQAQQTSVDTKDTSSPTKATK